MVGPCELYEIASHCELSNNITMILELIIAGSLAAILSLYFFTREQKDRIKLQTIIENDEKFRKKRRWWALDDIIQTLQDGQANIPSKSSIELFDPKEKEKKHQMFDTTPIDDFEFAMYIFEGIKETTDLYADVIEVEYLELILDLIKQIPKFDNITDKKSYILLTYDRTIQKVDELLALLTEPEIPD